MYGSSFKVWQETTNIDACSNTKQHTASGAKWQERCAITAFDMLQGSGARTEGNGFGGVQNVEVPLLVIPSGIGAIMEMQSAAPLASSAMWWVTSKRRQGN